MSTDAGARTYDLPGLRATLGRPRVVAEHVGFCWYPDILGFSTGELMITYSLNADTNTNISNAQAVLISTDRGKSWGTDVLPYDVNGFHNAGGEVRIARPDGSIVGPTTYLRPSPDDQARRFVGNYVRYDKGGRRYNVEPWGVTVAGMPRDVERWHVWSRTWWSRINWYSDAVSVGGDSYVATLSTRFVGDKRETTVCLRSDDVGRSWRYISTICGPDDIPDAKEGFDEPSMIRLEDGDLMCVSRVGSGKDQLIARVYSSDDGKTWSKPDRLPAYSVAPNLIRLKNGALAISTGRPGLGLWLSPDQRGKDWHGIDLVEHHNGTLEPNHHLRIGQGGHHGENPYQTTAYTAMIEIQPNRAFLVYDRVPFGWKPVPGDSEERERIYLVELTVERR